ncbi:MAG TPA: amidohydrolase family protein [Planctomycetota bacterium]|nr:amidohydrolase family protein [Planctomycetota bacterium]
MSSAYDALREHVFALDIIDTHEHLPAFERNRPRETDVLGEYLTHYFSSDLVSAGLSAEALVFARDHTKPLAERWKTVEPFWEAARHTGYGRSLDVAARLLYDIDAITAKSIGALDERFRAARAAGGHYDRVLRATSRIVTSIEDGGSACVPGGGDEVDFDYFTPVLRLDAFIMPESKAMIGKLVRETGVEIATLDDLKRAAETLLDRSLERGWIGLKCGLAYARSLKFERTSAADAASLRRLQDHMMHFVCALAETRKLPFQVHTGLQEGSGNTISNADPTLLSNLFMDYPNVRFDLFHIGYPYQQTMSALAKNFRNVFIDFAWVHIISPEASVRALVEYLDAVSANKISGFGGDYAFIDGVAGHAFIARENIARALAVKVDQGVFDVRRAKEVARMILFENPTALFKIDAGR